MSNSRIIVLKFGSSVLRQTGDVHVVAQEIYQWRRRGYQVLAVVSAIGGTTDQLTALASKYGEADDEAVQARLLATGELHSAALVGLALKQAGIPTYVGDDVTVGLATEGPLLDSHLTGVNECYLRGQLKEHGVVVLPGFIGRNRSGEQTLLGRGGTDLTALFLAAKLDAARCRLVKDVSGLYEYDPRLAEDGLFPRRYKFATFDDALALDESIVQHKAIRFAREADMPFEVGAISSGTASRVGRFSCSTFFTEQGQRDSGPVRVALIGLGTVGLGVYQHLTEHWNDQFEVVSIAVRDKRRAVKLGAPIDLLTDDPIDAVQSSCRILIELAGGIELPNLWVESALAAGKHVVTANKSLLAKNGNELHAIAEQARVQLRYSAAIGGSVPVLEWLQQLAETDQVVSVKGIVNGSTNYILTRVEEGLSLDVAIQEAKELGLTEDDHQRDTNGIDAAEKLVLVARACGSDLELESIECDELSEQISRGLDCPRLRQVAELKLVRTPDSVKAIGKVKVSAVSADSQLANVLGSENLLQLVCENSGKRLLKGAGAGRWPTSAAVIADLLDLCREASVANESALPEFAAKTL